MGLDVIKTLVFEAVGVEEEERLANAEDKGGRRNGSVGIMAREVAGRGSGDAGDRLDAVECYEENVIGQVEPYGRANSHLGRDEKSEPEGEHGCNEVDERGAPVVVEDAEGDNNMPDGGDNDSGKSSFRNPIESGTKLEDAEYDNRASNDTVGR